MSCRYCGKEGHTAWKCFIKPRKPLANKKALKLKGAKTAKWLEFKNQYLQDHPSSHEGYWWCSYCGLALTRDTVTLDHVIPRSRRPDLVFDPKNIVISCGACNSTKGST